MWILCVNNSNLSEFFLQLNNKMYNIYLYLSSRRSLTPKAEKSTVNLIHFVSYAWPPNYVASTEWIQGAPFDSVDSAERARLFLMKLSNNAITCFLSWSNLINWYYRLYRMNSRSSSHFCRLCKWARVSLWMNLSNDAVPSHGFCAFIKSDQLTI